MRLLPACALLAMCPPTAFAQVDTGLLTPWPEDRQVQLGGRAMLLGDSETDNADADFDLTTYEARGRVRLNDLDEGAPAIGFRLKYLDLDTSDPALPKRLVDQAAGFGMGVGSFDAFNEAWSFGFTAGLGYAGDAPFSDSDALYALGNLVAKAKLDEKSELRVILNYDGNRSIFPDLPLPYVAYTHQFSEALQWTIGFPYSGVRWQIDERLLLTARYFFPADGEVELAYTLHENWTLFAGYESSLDAFTLDAPGSDRDRLFFRQRRAEAGVRWSPYPTAELTFAGGYAFDQEFESGWDVRDTETVADIDDAPFVRAAVSLEF